MKLRGMVATMVAGLALVTLAGCAAAVPPTPSPTPVASAIVTPDQGQSLAALGFTNGPAALIWLPTGVQLTYTADQPNALIAAGDSSQAGAVQDYLRQTLPGLGWQITADADGGLMFQQGNWQGAYALGTDSWALTVRDD